MDTYEAALKFELEELKNNHQYAALKDDELFVLWFIRAYFTTNDTLAAGAICGGPNDKNIDAILIDQDEKYIAVIQGKYRQKFGAKSESRQSIKDFAHVVSECVCQDPSKEFLSNLNPAVKQSLLKARRLIKTGKYLLHAYYVTPGKVSPQLESEATAVARKDTLGQKLVFGIISNKQIRRIVEDYLDGVAPAVPEITLNLSKITGVTGGDKTLLLTDTEPNINTYIFPVKGSELVNAYNQHHKRLFARNIRGYLGKNPINSEIENTLQKNPDKFWYYNNGITIICDEVTKRGTSLKITCPQIINGQQTTRALANHPERSNKAHVLIKLIEMNRDSKEEYLGHQQYEALASKIVKSTNSQTAIKQSDLRSNDLIQVQLERMLRNLNYGYIRKQETKGEASVNFPKGTKLITKDDLAKSTIACTRDPSLLFSGGKEALYKDALYEYSFPKDDSAYDHLTRYWLTRLVANSKPKYRNEIQKRLYRYIRWHITNLIWQDIKNHLKSTMKKQYFCDSCRKSLSEENLKYLSLAASELYKSYYRFYRNHDKNKEVAGFVKTKNLNSDFNTYLNKKPNIKQRKKIKENINAFLKKFH